MREIELEEILLPHVAAAVGARHGCELRRAFEPDRGVPELGEDFQVAPGATAKIQDGERRLAFDVLQQRGDVLGDVMVAGALPELFGVPVIMLQRDAGNLLQLVTIQFHGCE